MPAILGIALLTTLVGLLLGLVVARVLWHKAIALGNAPEWFPKRFAPFYFGDLAQTLLEGRRSKIENERLRKDVKHFSTLLNLAPFPVWRRDANGQVTYCNLAYTSLLEHVPERILEEYGMELSESSHKLGERVLQAQATGVEELHMIIDGDRKLYRLCEMPDADLGGTVGFAFDESDREQAHEELRRHIGAQGELLEASNVATAIFNSEKKLTFYNSAYVSLWKLDRHWLAHHTGFVEIIEHLREKRRLPEMVNFAQFKQQRLKLFTDLLEPYEEILHLPDGKIVRMVILPYALGGLTFFYEDVTDKLAMERSYNTLIAVQRETLNNLHEAVAVFGEDGRLRLSNPIYQKFWGLDSGFVSTEPHIGEILEATKGYYNYTDWAEFKERLTTQLHVRKMNYQRIERTDGTVLDGSTVPLPDGATLITYLDVTDSTLVERSLIEKNEALREADRLKTEFLLSVSYELRSPLTSITGFSEILKEEYFGKLNQKQTEYLNAIHDSSVQLGQLINNILDLASIEAGYMRLDIRDCPVRQLLEEVCESVQAQARNNLQEVDLLSPYNIGAIEADAGRIKQVMFNLINNAMKFTPQGGHIRIGAKADGENEVVLWVEDNGAGIPEDEQGSVFERFRAGALRNQGAGAGLGLAMVKNFIDLHGGRIELKSTVGKGTKVSCYLPRRHPTVTAVTYSGSPLAAAE